MSKNENFVDMSGRGGRKRLPQSAVDRYKALGYVVINEDSSDPAPAKKQAPKKSEPSDDKDG